jgi:hypothetical protein
MASSVETTEKSKKRKKLDGNDARAFLLSNVHLPSDWQVVAMQTDT